jgi:hypothetical protein
MVVTHMDRRIFETAATMPLPELSKSLLDIAAAQPPDNPARSNITQAGTAISELTSLLLHRVMGHKLWQEADNTIDELSELVESTGAAIAPDVVWTWRSLKSQMVALQRRVPPEHWPTNMEKRQGEMEDRLATERADDELVLAVEAFREEALQQFFLVDTELKQNCTSLQNISNPLNRILKELDHA